MPALARRDAMLAAVATAFAGGAVATAAHPDAELLRLCAEWHSLNAQESALLEAWADVRGPWPPAIEARADGLSEEAIETHRRLSVIPCRTLEGLKAKAAVVRELIPRDRAGQPFSEDDVAIWDITRAVLALA